MPDKKITLEQVRDEMAVRGVRLEAIQAMWDNAENCAKGNLYLLDELDSVRAERDALLEKSRILASIGERAITHAERLEIQVSDDSGFALSLIDQNAKLTAQRDALRAMCQEFIEFQFSHHLGLHGLKAATDHYVALKRKARQVIEENS